MSNATASIEALTISDSDFRFPNEHGKIEYICQGAVAFWNRVLVNSSPCVHLTTIEVGSGGGKSTLMNLVHSFLLGRPTSEIHLRMGGDYSRRNVAYIPQKPNNVLHWKIGTLVPNNSRYLACMIEGLSAKFGQDRLASCSGGQLARILVASALHRLELKVSTSNYLLLDEAFEGLDSKLLAASLNGISQEWSQKHEDMHLFILIVTHLDVGLLQQALDPAKIDLHRVVLERQPSQFYDNGRYETIPVMLSVANHAH
jgi:ABC-type Mn2+/Zn2+ transport system ATPase subunit